MIGATAQTFERNPYSGPVSEDIVVVDKYGNAIPVHKGQMIYASPDGEFQQLIGVNGEPTGDRMGRGGHSRQRDPAAKRPHGHRPGFFDA